jgi:3-oxoadipate enol-lactonase
VGAPLREHHAVAADRPAAAGAGAGRDGAAVHAVVEAATLAAGVLERHAREGSGRRAPLHDVVASVDDPVVDGTRFITVPDGTRLAWDEAGSGPAVLLVHGIGYTRRKWDPQHAPLLAAGFRVLRFDLRGFGESSLPEGPHTMDDFVADLGAFVEAAGLGSFHLVGHSLGGMIAQLYAVRNAERLRSLALVSTTSHNGRRATAFARLMVTFAEHGFDTVLHTPSLKAEADAILEEAFPEGVQLSMLRRGMEEPSLARANAWRACIDFSAKDELGTLGCPVMVAHGTGDLLIPWRAGELVHQAIPGSEWLVEGGAGHSLPKERAASFNAGLIDFLQRAKAGAAPR